MSGWVVPARAPIERVEACLEDVSLPTVVLGPVTHGLPRPDVARAFPWREVAGAGYSTTFHLDPDLHGRRTLLLRVVDRQGREQTYRRALNLTGSLPYLTWRARHGIPAPPAGAAASDQTGDAEAVGGAGAPRVSICVPTFNGAAHLREALDSACAQTLEDLEILVVDDASTDQTLEIAREYSRRDHRVRVHPGDRRLGLAGNWNRSVALARGEWIKFLFQDDVLDPTCVERLLAAAGSGVAFVVCRRTGRFEPGVTADFAADWTRHVTAHNLARLFPGQARIAPAAFAEQVLREPTINCIGEPTATLVRRAVFARFGGFHPGLAHLVDWEHAARVALHVGCAYVDEPLATYRVHNASATARSRAAHHFTIEVIDPLVVLYEHAASPRYEPLRRVAARQVPPLDLGERLYDAVVEAHRRFGLVRTGSPAGARARDDWREALRRYPWLAGP